jgi:hypothetical protein
MKTTAQLDFKKLNEAAVNGTLPDSQNPIFIFSQVSNDLLVLALADKINLQALAEYELKSRGYDTKGNWIGFKK